MQARPGQFMDPVLRRERFTRRQAWDWLIGHAAPEDTRVSMAGATILLRRGQLCASMQGLADAWGWHKATAWRYLIALQDAGMAATTNATAGTIITICRYYEISRAGRGVCNDPATAFSVRDSVADLDALRSWVKRASPGALCTYHVGNLAQDRPKSRALHDLAEGASILQEVGALSLAQFRTSLPMLDGYTYTATRAKGRPPQALLSGEVDPWRWWALAALRDRPTAQSAVRAVRHALALSDRVALDVLNGLRCEPSPSTMK